jgi:hypothetical protein
LKRIKRKLTVGYRSDLTIDVPPQVKGYIVDLLILKHIQRPLQIKFKRVCEVLLKEQLKHFKPILDRECRKAITSKAGKKL